MNLNIDWELGFSVFFYAYILRFKQKHASQVTVIIKVADPLVSIEPFITSNDLRNFGVVHSKITNSLPILLVFKQQILFPV